MTKTPRRRPRKPAKHPAAPFRASLLRLIEIARSLRTGRPFTGPSLGAEVGVDSRTIKRDIQLLRSFGWAIDWTASNHSYTLRHAPRPVLL